MAVIRRSLDSIQFTPGKSSNSSSSSQQPHATFVTTVRSDKRNNKKFSWGRILLLLLFLFGIIVAYQWWQDKYGTVLGQSSSIIPVIVGKPHLSKDETGLTNVLLVGIDTRESGTVELNTDTILLASYNEDTHRVAMISFPRDFAVPYDADYDGWRINAVYAHAENKQKGAGLSALQKVVEDISGKSIQYSVMVDLKGFTDAISVVGGVDVFLEYDLSGEYPTPYFGYQRIKFEKGWNHFSGEQALQYSRMRKDMSPASEEGDFARAKRQQKVIQALVDKVSKTETLQDPAKVWGLLNTMKKNITISRVTAEDVQAGIALLKDKGKPQMFSYVLDFNAGNEEGRLVDMVSYVPYMIGPRLGIGKYSEIKQFITQYIDEPTLVTSGKPVHFVNTGNTQFEAKVNQFKSIYYYAKISSDATMSVAAPSYIVTLDDKTSVAIGAFWSKLLNITDVRKGTIENLNGAAVVVYLGP